MKYELGYHSSEVACPHVALRADDGTRDEFVDLRLHHTTDALDDPAFTKSLAAVELLLDRANKLLQRGDLSISFSGEAAERFQNLLDEFKGFGVTITPQEGEPYEAVLVGPDLGDVWYDKVIAYEVKDGEFLTLDEFRARGDLARFDRIIDIEIC